ncbi:MAG TPA: putative toxin-antitoxin system toxin component, PIN family [Terriglobia bacterium]|nr:putative toxin-antitoxin system toxin component, PIN family [Terriglobia bacterium]
MTPLKRIVVDNSAIISRLLLPKSVSGLAVREIVDTAQLLVSEPVLNKLADVRSRPKFDRYISIAERQQFLRLLLAVAEMVPIVYTIQACRDPKDDMLLELAVNGRADLIVTRDEDLLVLNPFRNIPIITPGQYLKC